MIKHKNFYWERHEEQKLIVTLKEMKNFNEILKQVIRSTKQSYFARLISQANGKTKWKIINRILNKNTKSSITTSINGNDFWIIFPKNFRLSKTQFQKKSPKNLYVKQHFLENVPQNILSNKMTCPMGSAYFCGKNCFANNRYVQPNDKWGQLSQYI